MPTPIQMAGLAMTVCLSMVQAGPYAPPANLPGSEAIPADSQRFSGWAVAHTNYLVGSDCDETFQTPLRALGPATSDVYDIVSLGRGGQITLYVDPPITDGPGDDLAVFENAVTQTFLELAYVEVSSDGDHFVRFPSDSLTPGPIGPFFDPVDSTDVDGLAGTYAVSYGTPFDLADLPAAPLLDRNRIRWVRVLDVVGDGRDQDSDGDPIYDPYPTVQSSGFDLEAVGVIHQAVELTFTAPQPGGLGIRFPTGTHRRYQLEYSTDRAQWGSWKAVGPELAGTGSPLNVVHPYPPEPAAVYRIQIRIEDPP